MKRTPPVVTDEDVAWCEEHAAALVKSGMASVDAYDRAVRVRAHAILVRADLAFMDGMLRLREERRRKRDAEDAAEREKLRAEQRAKATMAQRPTATATLGDMVKARKQRKR